MEGLPSPNTKTVIEGKIDAVLTEENAVERQTKWTDILKAVHSGATTIPISGKAIPAVYNDARLSGYVPGQQQFDYPMHTLTVLDSVKNITLAPGSQGGLFTGLFFKSSPTFAPLGCSLPKSSPWGLPPILTGITLAPWVGELLMELTATLTVT